MSAPVLRPLALDVRPVDWQELISAMAGNFGTLDPGRTNWEALTRALMGSTGAGAVHERSPAYHVVLLPLLAGGSLLLLVVAARMFLARRG